MLPLTFFADRRFSVGSAAITTSFFVMFGWFFLFSLYLQFARGYSPLEAGVAMLPFAPVFIILSPRSAAIAARLGSGRTIALGFLLVGLGMAVLGFTEVGTDYLVLVVAMVLMAAGMSITAAPATTSIMAAVPLSKAGVASAVNDTTRELGGALGIAVFGSIVSSLYRANLDLGSLDVPPAAAQQAEESLGAAVGAGAQVGGGQGAALVDRAANAFTDAFAVTATLSAAIVVVAAVAVQRTFSSAKELAAEATAAPEPEPAELDLVSSAAGAD
jgi:hypothetical protein